jgi:stringent starvation protein B
LNVNTLSQQPYFLRALYEWCVDSGHTPYLTVRVDKQTRVPQAFVRDGQIVLNVGPSAVRNMHMDNDWVTFSARFGGMSHSIEIPVGNVIAIYARETGEGMAFESLEPASLNGDADEQESEVIDQEADVPASPSQPKGRPHLTVVK